MRNEVFREVLREARTCALGERILCVSRASPSSLAEIHQNLIKRLHEHDQHLINNLLVAKGTDGMLMHRLEHERTAL